MALKRSSGARQAGCGQGRTGLGAGPDGLRGLARAWRASGKVGMAGATCRGAVGGERRRRRRMASGVAPSGDGRIAGAEIEVRVADGR